MDDRISLTDEKNKFDDVGDEDLESADENDDDNYEGYPR